MLPSLNEGLIMGLNCSKSLFSEHCLMNFALVFCLGTPFHFYRSGMMACVISSLHTPLPPFKCGRADVKNLSRLVA